VPETDFAEHASAYGKLQIGTSLESWVADWWALRHVTTLHCMPRPRPRRAHATATLRIRASTAAEPSLDGGGAISRCPTGLPPCCCHVTPFLGLFDPACGLPSSFFFSLFVL
jgi:hypothetical protein